MEPLGLKETTDSSLLFPKGNPGPTALQSMQSLHLSQGNEPQHQKGEF